MDIRIGHLNIIDHLILALAGNTDTCSPSRLHPGMDLSGMDLSGMDLSGMDLPEICLLPLNAWTQIATGLRSGDLDAAFITIPLAMSLFHDTQDLSLLMFTHRGGSRMAAALGVKQIKTFQGKSMLIPHVLSVQHMLAHRFLGAKDIVLETMAGPDGVCAEAVPSVLMEEMIARDNAFDIAGVVCEEPFATRAMEQGVVRPLLSTGDLWPDHPGSAFVVRRQLLDQHPAAMTRLIRHFLDCAQVLDKGIAPGSLPDDGILDAAAEFLKQPRDLAARALSRSKIRFSPSLLVPDLALIDIIARYMCQVMGALPGPIDTHNFVDTRLALNGVKERMC